MHRERLKLFHKKVILQKGSKDIVTPLPPCHLTIIPSTIAPPTPSIFFHQQHTQKKIIKIVDGGYIVSMAHLYTLIGSYYKKTVVFCEVLVYHGYGSYNPCYVENTIHHVYDLTFFRKCISSLLVIIFSVYMLVLF